MRFAVKSSRNGTKVLEVRQCNGNELSIDDRDKIKGFIEGAMPLLEEQDMDDAVEAIADFIDDWCGDLSCTIGDEENDTITVEVY